MPETIRFEENYINDMIQRIRKISGELEDASNEMGRLDVVDTGAGSLSTRLNCRISTLGAVCSASNMSSAFRQTTSYLSRLSDYSQRLANNLQTVSNRFVETENKLMGVEGEQKDDRTHGGTWVSIVGDDTVPTLWDKFKEEFGSNLSWGALLGGGNYIKDVYSIVQNLKENKSFGDLIKNANSIFDFAQKVTKDFKNYWKIGNAVGQNQAMTWWAKNAVGFKKVGRVSTAKNVVTRFKNNLTNKTSPFNAQLKNTLDDFTGANGAGKAVAKWGGVILDGVMNFFSNKEEQAASNGTMSDGRVVAETITETAVGTVLTYTAGAVIGAGISAVAGTVALPGVVVAGLTAITIAGVNAGTKAITGKTATELISDGILDLGQSIGDGAKKAFNAVGNWFNKLRFT